MNELLNFVLGWYKFLWFVATVLFTVFSIGHIIWALDEDKFKEQWYWIVLNILVILPILWFLTTKYCSPWA